MHRSAEEVEANHLQVLGPLLGPLYYALYNEVVWLHAKWLEYRHLYAKDETVELLNDAAGFFFRMLQDVMWEDAILHLARLLDPPRSMGKDNLTLKRLPEVIIDPSLAARVETLIKSAESACKFAREWRNRHLAHRDLQLALDVGAEPLCGVSREHMEQALAALGATLNEIESHYWNSTVGFRHFRSHTGAESLTYHLKKGVTAERNRLERLSKGNLLPEDLEP